MNKNSTTILLSDEGDYLRLHGRVTRLENGLGIDWTNSGFTICADCEGDIRVAMQGVRGVHSYMLAEVDGEELTVEQVLERRVRVCEPAEYVVAKALPAGRHTIRLYKLNEATSGLVDATSVTLCGELAPLPPQSGPRMEFIGDSITCGLHNLWTGEPSVTPTPTQDYEDGYHAYDAFIARRFGAEFRAISLSGWGVVYGYGEPAERNIVPRVYDYTSYCRNANECGKWDFSSWQPDLVVVNLGTNDWNASVQYTKEPDIINETIYREKVLAFLEHLRECYPKAHILWAHGLLGIGGNQDKGIAWAMEQRRTAGDTAMSYVALPSNFDGGCWHPSVAGHATAADVAATKIRCILKK